MRIKDNDVRSKSEFSDVGRLIGLVADKTIGELESKGVIVFPPLSSQSEIVYREQMILRSENENFRSGNLLGFLGYGEERLEVVSRFSSDKDFFLSYMLMKVFCFPAVVSSHVFASYNERILSFLAIMFPYYLSNAMRKGIYKSYRTVERNDSNIKGTIDVPRHIKDNVPFMGTISYNERIFASNNSLTQLIRHAIEIIRTKPYGKSILDQIQDEVKKVVEVTYDYEHSERRRVLIENQNKPIKHAYYHEYLSLQKLCINILLNERGHIGSGEQKSFGIVFDGSWLWEEYINSLINGLFHHPQNRIRKNGQNLFANTSKGVIYPDFISMDQTNRVIADAKYKRIDNIRSEDFLQVLAYMFRFDAKVGCYIFPSDDAIDSEEFYLAHGTTFESVGSKVDNRKIKLYKVGLKIPQKTDSFDSFVDEITKNENEFKERIFQVLQNDL